ncbi:MAG: response regulator [Candidatus Nanopelagicales bacterium]
MSGSDRDRLTVMVAEDEALIRMDLVETLEELGFAVVGSVADGSAAVELATRSRPQVALLGIKMPDMDGLAVASKIIAMKSTAVVMLSALSQPELIQRAAAAGAMGYLVKPFKPEELRRPRRSRGSGTASCATNRTGPGIWSRASPTARPSSVRGVTCRRNSISELEAYTWLRKAAMDQRRTLAEVARMTPDAAAGESDPTQAHATCPKSASLMCNIWRGSFVRKARVRKVITFGATWSCRQNNSQTKGYRCPDRLSCHLWWWVPRVRRWLDVAATPVPAIPSASPTTESSAAQGDGTLKIGTLLPQTGSSRLPRTA